METVRRLLNRKKNLLKHNFPAGIKSHNFVRNMSRILIVGSGITGAVTASLLKTSKHDYAVTVWDKARGSGITITAHFFCIS